MGVRVLVSGPWTVLTQIYDKYSEHVHMRTPTVPTYQMASATT